MLTSQWVIPSVLAVMFTVINCQLNNYDQQILINEHNRLRVRTALGQDGQPQAADMIFLVSKYAE